MYNLMIVDDESIIRERIACDYDWESMGFCVCASVSNGKEALEQLELIEPDVILTDLVMPVMNGLELISRLKQCGCQAKVVVLSGYSDFENVKAAMQLGAVDYLLKPLKNENVHAVFPQLAANLEGSASRQKPLRYTNSFNLANVRLCQHVFLEYLTGKQTAEYSAGFLADVAPGYSNTLKYILAFLHIRLAAAADWLPSEMSAIFREAPRPLCFPYRDYFVLLLPQSGGSSSVALQELLRRVPEQSAAACVLSEPMPFSELAECFSLFAENIHAFFYSPRGQISPLDTIRLLAPTATSYSAIKANSGLYLQLILEQDADGLLDALDQLFQQVVSHPINPDLLIARLTEMYTEISQQVKKYEPGSTVRSFAEILCQLQQAFSFEELCSEYRSVFLDLTLSFQQARGGSNNQFQQVAQYIKTHYAEDISLSELAEKFHLNPTYLCAMFSKMADMTFVNYTRNLRLEKAVEYLVNSDMSISKIAEAVGYPNYRYFCKLFKQAYGVIPKQYRQNHHRGLSGQTVNHPEV